jgi:hypothetical protein
MNFGTFQDFSKEEAAQWLSRFLSEEADAMTEYAADLARDGVACDFSLSSIPAHAVWVADHTQTIKLGTDPSVPDWIKESEGYASHNFEFDDDSRVLLLRLAYYLGEWGLSDKVCEV